MAIEVSVNGSPRHIEADPDTPLLRVLRDTLGLTGAKYGCGEGLCGACAVLVDGHAVNSCVTPLSAVAGSKVTTVEGLETNGRLHPMQQAFLDQGAMQCAYCTPGMILGAISLLNTKPAPTETDIVEAMDGHICRCGTYTRIVDAIRLAASRQAGNRSR